VGAVVESATPVRRISFSRPLNKSKPNLKANASTFKRFL